MRSISEIIRDTLNLITNATEEFADSVRKNVEPTLWNGIQEIIDFFDITDGLFSDSNSPESVVDLDERISNAVSNSGLKEEADKYKVNFDLVDDLAGEYFRTTLRLPEDDSDLIRVFRDTSPEKAKIIDDLDLYILNDSVLSANVLKEVRDEIFEAVILRKSKKELEDRIRGIIISTDGEKSKLLRYVGQVSNDTLSSYNGVLQNKGREIYDLDRMTYSGPILDTTRQFCFDLLTSSGRYEPFAIRRGVYRYEDLEKILELSTQCVAHHTLRKKDGSPVIDCGRGLMPDTTPETFSKKRGGYNCTDQAFFSRLTARDKRIIEDKGIGQ